MAILARLWEELAVGGITVTLPTGRSVTVVAGMFVDENLVLYVCCIICEELLMRTAGDENK